MSICVIDPRKIGKIVVISVLVVVIVFIGLMLILGVDPVSLPNEEKAKNEIEQKNS